MSDYTITATAANAAQAASRHAGELARYLMPLAEGSALPPHRLASRAEWAFEAFDALTAEMAKIPRPVRDEEAA